MKIRIEQTSVEENEVILRCAQLDDEMLRVLSLLRSGMQKLLVWNEQRETLPLSVSKVVYCETVEEKPSSIPMTGYIRRPCPLRSWKTVGAIWDYSGRENPLL